MTMILLAFIARSFMILLAFIGVLSANQCKAQSPGDSTTPARALDGLVRDYAYRAFVHPRTGVPYNGQVPSNLTGIKIAMLRLRSGSLRNRGVPRYKEFRIPIGIVVQPYVLRLALVYQDLGNWSSVYYPLPGFTYLTPVLGLLVYNATDLSDANLSELGIVVLRSPILINFANVSPVPSGLVAKCVWFDLDGLPEFRDLVSSNVCSTYRRGHFSIVVNSTGFAFAPASSGGPSPSKGSNSRTWKIIGGVVGGFVALVMLALLLACMLRYTQDRKVAEMEWRAEDEESLRTALVGNTQAPAASGTRTQSLLENEFMGPYSGGS